MKKRVCLSLLLIFLLEIMSSIIIGETTAEKIITGDATQTLGINVSIIAYFPLLTIISPRNGTYIVNESLLLNYSVSGQQAIWYYVDELPSTIINSSLTFNISQGSHTLYLYANSSFGNITARNVSFSVDSGIHQIDSNKYESSTKGGSTNFNEYTYAEIQNLSDVILEHANWGKIFFNQNINLTNDENPADNIINISAHINISSNRIWINSTALPNFDKPATLSLYGLSLSNPRILIDGEVCPSAICKNESYSGGTLKFNVTGFTVYSAGETPAATTTTTTTTTVGGTTGGSSGGGFISIKRDFSVTPSEIKVSLKQGKVITKNIIITNEGNEKLEIKIERVKAEDLLLLPEEKNFRLNPKESRTVTFDIVAREDTLPNFYLGKIIIKSGAVKKEILVGIEVESKDSLLDVKATIPSIFSRVSKGGELLATVNLYNLGQKGEIDVKIDYQIIDTDGNTISTETETLAVSKQTSFVKTMKIPEEIKSGRYILYIKATYNGEIASSSAWFDVRSKGIDIFRDFSGILLAFLILLLIFIAFQIRKIKKRLSINYKINENTLIRENLIKIGK